MKRMILIFGSVIGAILTANAIVMVNMMYSDTDFKGNDIVVIFPHEVGRF